MFWRFVPSVILVMDGTSLTLSWSRTWRSPWLQDRPVNQSLGSDPTGLGTRQAHGSFELDNAFGEILQGYVTTRTPGVPIQYRRPISMSQSAISPSAPSRCAFVLGTCRGIFQILLLPAVADVGLRSSLKSLGLGMALSPFRCQNSVRWTGHSRNALKENRTEWYPSPRHCGQTAKSPKYRPTAVENWLVWQ
jgi:hypothetical protein